MQIKNTFTSGKMNKDTDIRLIPNGEYIHCENLRFFSDGKNGVGQSIRGNVIADNKTNENEYTCIKAISDIASENIYYFIANDTDSKIIEYNIKLETSKILIQGDLKFNPNKKILGANILNDSLYWVEQHNNPPRRIDITKSAEYLLGFTEDDISIIKEPPFQEPRISLRYDANFSEEIKDRWISFAYRYRYNDDSYSAISFYSDFAFRPKIGFDFDYTFFSNIAMKNQFNSAIIFFNTGGKNVIEIDLLFRESNSNSVYIIQTLNKAKEGYLDNIEASFEFINNKIYFPISTDDVNSFYDNVPLKAKSQELIGNTLIYANYYDGYNQIDKDNIEINYQLQISLESTTQGQIVLVNKTNSNDLEINFNQVSLKEGNLFFLEVSLIDSQSRSEYQEFYKQYQIILNQDYTANSLSTSSQFENLLSAINDDLKKQLEVNFPLSVVVNRSNSITVNEINNRITINKYFADITKTEDVLGVPTQVTSLVAYNFSSIGNSVYLNQEGSNKSLHSNRTYEVCIIHYDKYNRPVGLGTGINNTIYIPHERLSQVNKIKAKPLNKPPKNAIKYKFGIKQSKKDYETIYSQRIYNDTFFRWIKLEGEAKSKVIEGDIIILKNRFGEIITDYKEISVLEVSIKNNNFLGNNEPGGVYFKINGEESSIYKPNSILIDTGKINNRDTSGRARVYLQGLNISIPAGSFVSMFFDSYRGGGNHRIYKETITALQNYSSFFDMAVRQNLKFGEFGNYNVWVRQEGNVLAVYALYASSFLNASIIDAQITITDGSKEFLIFETKPKDNSDVLFYEFPGTYKIENGEYLNEVNNPILLTNNNNIILNAYNCYSFGNGAESYVLNDGLREKNNYLNFNFRGWATLEDGYKETHRATDLIHSDIFRKETKFNGLSKFYSHLPNFKTLFEEYGEIQDIKNRDTNLFIAQNNKLGIVMYGKSVLYTQAGEETLQTTNEVLGNYIGLLGIYGIGKHPESIAEFNKVIYLADPKRGQILSVVGNEVSVISSSGFENHTRELFLNNTNLLGGFDPNNYEYLLFIGGELNKTLGFQAQTGGFNSFFTYQPDFIFGVDKMLYTWKNGVMYKHNYSNDYNNYYGVKHPSLIEFTVNQFPSDDKIFTCLSIEDTEAWDVEVETKLGNTHINKEQFIKKESFWFANINKNEKEDLSNAYGIGEIVSINGNNVTIGSVPIQMSVGDKIGKDNSRYDLINRVENVLQLNNAVGLNVGDFIFGLKNGLFDGADIIGEYAKVKMTKTSINNAGELFSVNTEIIKSN